MRKYLLIVLFVSGLILTGLNGIAQIKLFTEHPVHTTSVPGHNLINLSKSYLFVSVKELVENVKKAKERGAYQEVISYCNWALPYMQLFDKEMVGGLFMEIGDGYVHLGKNELSLYNYQKALDNIVCNHRDKHEMHTDYKRNIVYISMSNVYNSIKDYRKAVDLCNKAADYFSKKNLPYWQGLTNGIKANSYKGIGWDDSALRSAQFAYGDMARFRSGEKPVFLIDDGADLTCRIAAHIAEMFLNNHQTDSASFYLNDIRSIAPKALPFTQIWIDLDWGRIYAQQGKGQLAEAKLQQSIHKADSLNYRSLKDEALQYAVQYYQQRGNTGKAFQYLQQLYELKEAANTQPDVHRIHQLELNYLTERKDREIAEKKLLLKHKEIQLRERNFLLYSAIAGCILLLTMSLLLYRNYRNKKLLLRATLLNVQQEQKITNLQSRVSGEEQERKRIARELHDSIISQLLAVQLHLQAIEDQPNQQAAQKLPAINKQLDATAKELRQIAHNLLPSSILDQGLVKGISFLCHSLESSTGIEVTFEVVGNFDSIPQAKALSLFRIVQELLQNVVKHAGATEVLVQLTEMEDMFSLTVEDNGKGLSFAEDGKLQAGLGLKNILERVELLNGNFHIKNQPTQGTTAYIEIYP